MFLHPQLEGEKYVPVPDDDVISCGLHVVWSTSPRDNRCCFLPSFLKTRHPESNSFKSILIKICQETQTEDATRGAQAQRQMRHLSSNLNIISAVKWAPF